LLQKYVFFAYFPTFFDIFIDIIGLDCYI